MLQQVFHDQVQEADAGAGIPHVRDTERMQAVPVCAWEAKRPRAVPTCIRTGNGVARAVPAFASEGVRGKRTHRSVGHGEVDVHQARVFVRTSGR
jgi:hypothetical protein